MPLAETGKISNFGSGWSPKVTEDALSVEVEVLS